MSSIPQVAEDQQIEEVPTSEARQLFTALYGDALPRGAAVHVRFVPEQAPGAEKVSSVRLRWYTLDTLPDVWPQDVHVFFGVGLRPQKRTNAILWTVLHADLDTMTAYIAPEGFPLPTALVSSGGGLHVYWKIRIPITDKAEAYQYLRLIQRKLGADPNAAEPARVLRVPGTTNVKAAYGDPRPCRLLEQHPERVYDLADFGTPEEGDEPRPAPSQVVVPVVEMADAEVQAILNRAGAATNGEKFRPLWEGRWKDLPNIYPSRSEADQALSSLLYFWTGGDLGRADAMFRRSGLFRPKWDESHYASGMTYGEHTLGRCVGGEVYQYAASSTRLVQPIPVRTWEQIMAEEYAPPSYLADGLIFEDGIGVCGGLAYAFKSTAMLDMAISLAAGIPVFNRFAVPKPVPALYAFAEQSIFWTSRIQRIALARGVDTRDIPFMLASLEGRALSNPDHMNDLIRTAQDVGARVTFIDSLASAFGVESESDASPMVRDFRHPVQRFVREAESAVVVIHHAPKSLLTHEPFDALETLRGSGDIGAATDSVLGLWVDQKSDDIKIKALVKTRGKRIPTFTLGRVKAGPETTLNMDDADFTPVTYVGEWDKHASAEHVLSAIRTMHAETHAPVTWTQIAEHVGGSKPTVFRRIQTLLDRKVIARLGEAYAPVYRREEA